MATTMGPTRVFFYQHGRTTLAEVQVGQWVGFGSTCRRLEDRDNPGLARSIALRRALDEVQHQLAKDIKVSLRRNCKRA